MGPIGFGPRRVLAKIPPKPRHFQWGYVTGCRYLPTCSSNCRIKSCWIMLYVKKMGDSNKQIKNTSTSKCAEQILNFDKKPLKKMATNLKSPGRPWFATVSSQILSVFCSWAIIKICAMFCADLFISWKTSTKLPAQSNLRGTQQCICDASRAHLSIIAPLASPPCIAQFFGGSAVGMALTKRPPASFLRIVWQKPKVIMTAVHQDFDR